MMQDFFSNPMFGIVLSIAAFQLGLFLINRLKISLANPFLIAVVSVIAVLVAFGIPLESYNKGGDMISLFLSPATAILAVSIYRQAETLKRCFLPVVAGCFVGSLTSMVCVVALCRLFGLDNQLLFSLLPKSVTTPIALEICEQFGGIPAITVAALLFTGILGAVFSPLLVKLLHVRNPVAAGVAIGTCSHAVGTSRAIQMGEIEGAMSSISIGVAGLSAVLLTLIFRVPLEVLAG